VRLPQRPDIILKYDDLLKVERSGRETWYIPELNEEINVIELLNGFESERDRNSKDPMTVNHNYYQYGERDNVAGDGVKGNKINS
jgi:hypothetical protein